MIFFGNWYNTYKCNAGNIYTRERYETLKNLRKAFWQRKVNRTGITVGLFSKLGKSSEILFNLTGYLSLSGI